MTFVAPDGTRREVEAPLGHTVLEIAHDNGIDALEGTCGGSMACSTCHVVVEEPYFSCLGSPSEEEDEILDLAFGLERTSRLGCQIVITPDLDGLTVRLPRV